MLLLGKMKKKGADGQKIQCFESSPSVFTVWKFQDFSIIHILREINFWDSRSAKSAILTHLEALDFDF